MTLNWRTELPCWLLLLAMFATASVNWALLPDSLPVHFGLDMKPDGWGGKFEALLGFPLVVVGLYLALTFLPRVDPRPHDAGFLGAYLTVRLAVLAFLFGIYVVMLRSYRTAVADLAAAIPVLFGGLLIVIGNILSRLGPNGLIGIRTPWTLSSRRSWIRTHQVGRWVFVACGALMMLSPLAGWPWGPAAALGVFFAAALWVAVYSYYPWRDDPDKVPPGGPLRAGG